VGVLEGEGGGGAVLPRLGAEVVVEAGAGGHGLGVEVGGERAVLHEGNAQAVSHLRLRGTLPVLALARARRRLEFELRTAKESRSARIPAGGRSRLCDPCCVVTEPSRQHHSPSRCRPPSERVALPEAAPVLPRRSARRLQIQPPSTQ
jgi:hypothetical protein